MEAHSGQQSFESYAKGQREAILASVAKTGTWRGVHQVLAVHGLEIKPHGAGLVIKSKNGAHAIKASSLDRSLSKSRLEKQLGPYQMPDASFANIHATTVYEAKPLHRDPERGSLYAEYQGGIAKRKASLASLNARDATAREHLAREWERKRKELEAMALTTRDRFRLLRQARQFEIESRKRLAKNMTKKRKEICEEVPFTSWASFLRTKAAQGNEVALAILRSRNAVVGAERDVQSDKPKTFEQRQAARLPWFERQREIREANGVNSMQKKELAAIARMHQLAAMEKASGSGRIFKDFSCRIDAKGTVLFTLASGGLVRDAGDQIFFSAHDKAAQDVALKLAQAKWGKAINLEGNSVQRERQQGLMKQREKERNPEAGWER